MKYVASLFGLLSIVVMLSASTQSIGKIIPPPPWGDPPLKIGSRVIPQV